MTIDAVIAFFILGALSVLAGAKISFPKSLYQSLSLFLMLAIGLKGGLALQTTASLDLIPKSAVVLAFGLLLPLIAYPILRYFGQFNRINSGAIAAHYGSVSVGTYAVAVALLETSQIIYEAYFPLFVVILEVPAIIVGLMLAKGSFKSLDKEFVKKELFANQSLLLMLGALSIGYFGGNSVDKIMPLFGDLFAGVLALFLLKMGMTAAEQLHSLKQNSLFLVSFAIMMPLIGGLIGMVVGEFLELSPGGVALMAILGASSSYIAVPAAMKVSLPEANAGLSISASLGITFPFNVIVAVPLFIQLSLYR